MRLSQSIELLEKTKETNLSVIYCILHLLVVH